MSFWALCELTAVCAYISTADTGLGSLVGLVGFEVKENMHVWANMIDFVFGHDLWMTAFYSSGSSYCSDSFLIWTNTMKEKDIVGFKLCRHQKPIHWRKYLGLPFSQVVFWGITTI